MHWWRSGFSVGRFGAVQMPNSASIPIYLRLRPHTFLWLALFLFFLGGVLSARAGGPADDLNLTGGEFAIYAHGSIQQIADCKVDRVFTDHRRFGFFHVQLLPLLVVQGVRLELADQTADGGWADSFKSDWLPGVRHDGMEWRDMSVTVKADGSPAIHADRAVPAKVPGAICRLENITLTARGDKWQTAHAELRNENGHPRVVWRAGEQEFHWDLFTGQMTDPSIEPKAEK